VNYAYKLTLASVFLTSSVLALAQPIQYQHALDDTVFQNCDEVFSRAISLASDIRVPAYIMELFPKSRGTVLYPFPSEVTAASAAEWIGGHNPDNIPYALFYYLNGAYTLRCRDNDRRYSKLSGPFGAASPLDLTFSFGKAEIWYFYVTLNYRNAFAFLVTEASLTSLNASDEATLIARMKDLLSARFVQSIYLRNDPWFLGTAPNSLIYLFTDPFKKITLQEYLATKTLDCNENDNHGCKLQLIY